MTRLNYNEIHVRCSLSVKWYVLYERNKKSFKRTKMKAYLASCKVGCCLKLLLWLEETKEIDGESQLAGMFGFFIRSASIDKDGEANFLPKKKIADRERERERERERKKEREKITLSPSMGAII